MAKKKTEETPLEEAVETTTEAVEEAEQETVLETWHNKKLDETGGRMYLSVDKTFADANHFNHLGEPIIHPAGSFYWEDAQTAYQLHLERKVSHGSVTRDPMDGIKDPDRFKTDAKRREQIYAQNPFHFGAAGISTTTGTMRIPLDHQGKPWVAVAVGETEDGATKFVYVPEEFKGNIALAQTRENLVYGSFTSVPTKVYEQVQDENHWYILKDPDFVRANVIQLYVDFFSGRIYSEGENVAMYAEEFDRAKREGYATQDAVVKMKVLQNFEDDYINARFNPCVSPRPRTKGQTFYATEERAEQLRELGYALPADEANTYSLASPGYFKGEQTIAGDSTQTGRVRGL